MPTICWIKCLGLPEVETIRIGLEPIVVGATVEEIEGAQWAGCSPRFLRASSYPRG